MKKHKILTLLVGAFLLAPLFQSCLKDDDDVFEQNPSERLQAVLSSTKQVLMNSEEGWLFEMYPESSQGYGGWAFTVRFDEEKVYARTELAGDNSYEESSYYKMTDDDGPVLTFDTYNTLLHYLSTPSSSMYEAFEGEFEFVIMETTEELVTLRGKKTGNIMYLRKLHEEAEGYLDKVAAIEDCLILSGFEGLVGSLPVTGTIDTDYRQITFLSGARSVRADVEEAVEDEAVTVAYAVTDDGLRFYRPIEIGGKTLAEMTIDAESNVLTGKGEGASDVVLTPVFPEGWQPYDAFEGKYLLSYNRGNYTAEVTLTAVGDKSTYIMSGLSDKFTLTLNYVKSSGVLELNSQPIGNNGSNVVWFCAWDNISGSLTWATYAGMVTEWNGDEENPVYTWVDNGKYPSITTNSFIMWQLTSSGSSAGQFVNSAWAVNGSNRFSYMGTLTKIGD